MTPEEADKVKPEPGTRPHLVDEELGGELEGAGAGAPVLVRAHRRDMASQ
jgi:hypothetical protein